jgi:AmmeMemoRadiSam system protein B
VAVGRHGIKVVRGDASGLFLPSVAIDSDWDSERFLDHVCIKAGLPPTAWRDDATALFTFEGESLRGRCREPSGTKGAGPTRLAAPVTRQLDKPQVYADFCRSNLAFLLSGRLPSYYLPGASDGNVSGVVLQVRPPGRKPLHFSQLSLRHGVPLQATLFSLTQAAAQRLAADQITPEILAGTQADVGMLSDPMLHGTVADPHLAGLDPRHRAVLVLERNKTALVHDPSAIAEELLTEAAMQARVTEPHTATVFSLDILANNTPLCVSSAPSPVRGPAVRPPAVAGKFYDADPAELSSTVDRLLTGERRPEPWPAGLVPHASLRYSGHIAAAVLCRLAFPRTIIIIGPKHTSQGVDWAVAPQQTWALPGGGVESDFMLARQLCQAIPGLEMDAAAHQHEHAIEVELPLLARLAPGSRVVGIAIGHANREDCRRIANGLAELLRERKERSLLLISSDMNHFATDAETRRLDALALSALERCDPDALHETVTRHSISMCGVLPAVIVLETLRLLGNRPKAERVGYATTADVTGETSRVVGYAGMVFGQT